MTNRRFIFTSAHFRCGCAYRVLFDAVFFCPTHHEPIIEYRTTVTPTPEIPDIPGLVMSRIFKDRPETLRNHAHNSLHKTINVQDRRRQDWGDTGDEENGLCPACFVQHQDFIDTRVAACECRDEQCDYRWCGQTGGLHAWWGLHATGRSHELTGIPEEDIFSHGAFEDLNDEVTQVLTAEEQWLKQAASLLVARILVVRSQPAPEDHQHEGEALYLAPCLDENWNIATDPSQETATQDLARRKLGEKLLRLHLIGAINPQGLARPLHAPPVLQTPQDQQSIL